MDKDFIKQCQITNLDNCIRITNLSRMIKSNASKISFYKKKLKSNINQDDVEIYETLLFELTTRQANLTMEKCQLERENVRLHNYIREELEK